MATQIKMKLDATSNLPEIETTHAPNTGCSACGKCGPNKSPLLNQAEQALLNLAGGAYTLEQLGTAIEIIEALLKQHYSKDNKK